MNNISIYQDKGITYLKYRDSSNGISKLNLCVLTLKIGVTTDNKIVEYFEIVQLLVEGEMRSDIKIPCDSIVKELVSYYYNNSIENIGEEKLIYIETNKGILNLYHYYPYNNKLIKFILNLKIKVC